MKTSSLFCLAAIVGGMSLTFISLLLRVDEVDKRLDGVTRAIASHTNGVGHLNEQLFRRIDETVFKLGASVAKMQELIYSNDAPLILSPITETEVTNLVGVLAVTNTAEVTIIGHKEADELMEEIAPQLELFAKTNHWVESNYYAKPITVFVMGEPITNVISISRCNLQCQLIRHVQDGRTNDFHAWMVPIGYTNN